MKSSWPHQNDSSHSKDVPRHSYTIQGQTQPGQVTGRALEMFGAPIKVGAAFERYWEQWPILNSLLYKQHSFHMLTAGQSSISLREERKTHRKILCGQSTSSRNIEILWNIQSAQLQWNKPRKNLDNKALNKDNALYCLKRKGKKEEGRKRNEKKTKIFWHLWNKFNMQILICTLLI